jgi:hypothetical protein
MLQPGNDCLRVVQCLKKMFSLEGQRAVDIIMDEPDGIFSRPGVPSSREGVLKLVGLYPLSPRLSIPSRAKSARGRSSQCSRGVDIPPIVSSRRARKEGRHDLLQFYYTSGFVIRSDSTVECGNGDQNTIGEG